MKKLLFILFLLTGTNSFAQECGKTDLSPELKEKKLTDSIYRKGIEQRIEYFAVLNQEILPKYFDLKSRILGSIENSDLKEISELKDAYEENRLNYLTEMKETQERVYRNVTPYSKIYNIVLFETLDVFPDSYGILFNPQALIRTRLRGREKIISNKLYKNYSKKLSEFSSCTQQMKDEMSAAKKKLEIVDINQNIGNKTEEETKKADLVDLLIWSLK